MYQWGEPQEKAFNTLNDLLCAAPVLAYPIPLKKFNLDSDASGYGISDVLSQVANATEKVIGYYVKPRTEVLCDPTRATISTCMANIFC